MRKREESKRRIHRLDAIQQYGMMAEHVPSRDAVECFSRPAYAAAASQESTDNRGQREHGEE